MFRGKKTIFGGLALGGGFLADLLGAPPQVGQALKGLGAPVALSGARLATNVASHHGISRTHVGSGLLLGAYAASLVGYPEVSEGLRVAGVGLGAVGLRSAIARRSPGVR